MNKILKSFFKSTALICLSAFVLVSCDPEKGKEPLEPDDNGQTEQPENPDTPGTPEEPTNPKADSLENALQRQVRAMYQIANEETLLLASVAQGKYEGLYDMSFESGESFKVYVPAAEGTKLLAFVDEAGVKYWAASAEDGTVAPVKNETDGKLASDSEPTVKLVSDEYCLVSDSQVYKTGYVADDAVQAFDCVLKADNAGEIYAVDYNVGSEIRTVYVSSYQHAKFYLAADEAKEAITELCVNWGTTGAVGFYIPEGVPYKVVVSEGWKAELNADTGMMDITAPEEAEGAQPQGTVAVVSEDDIFTFAQLNVTTDVFKAVFASAVKAVVAPSFGVDKYAYGIAVKADFDADAIIAKATEWIAGTSEPETGAALAEAAVAVPFAQLLGAELEAETEYVLWAVANGNIMSTDFTKMTFDLEVVKPYLLDADVKLVANGADAVFAGMVEKSDAAMEDIVFQLENSIQDSIPAANRNFVYEGKLSDYPAVDSYVNEMEPEKTYIMWATAAVTGEYEYTADDVFFIEVTTNSVVEGGAINIELTDVTTSRTSISAKVSAPGAAQVYYAVLNNTNGKRYSTAANADKYAQIKKAPLVLKGGSGEIVGEKLNPNTDYWLFAVAVDEEGKYGEVACVTGKTGVLTFDTSITLKSEKVDVTAKKAVIKVTSTGGDLSDYIYWFGRVTDPFWANSTHCRANKTDGEKYMALYPDDENIVKCMSKYGELGADGTITFDGLTMETEYIFMILEKGAENYSKTGYLKITTLAADLGVIVREGTDTWNKAKSSIQLDWIQSAFRSAANSQMMAAYAFNFSCPKNLTAYVMAASENYFTDAGFTKVEHIMIEIENYASRRYASSKTPYVDGVHATEPDYYKNGVLCQGQLMNVYDFCIHGVPALGFVTYFAEDSHGEGNCIYWENGVCTMYEEAVASIARYNTLEPWEEKAQQFGLQGDEAAAWAQDLLEAYSVYYKDAKPSIYVNNGSPLTVNAPYASGKDDEGNIPDRVVVMLKDLDGNYYEPMFFEVPDYFE